MIVCLSCSGIPRRLAYPESGATCRVSKRSGTDPVTFVPMITTAEALRTALEHHRVGQLREAEAIYRQIIKVEPQHADAWHLLGVVAHQLGHWEIAIQLISRAITLRGNQSMFHYNLGEAYRVSGKLGEAIGSYRQTLRIDPNDPKASNNVAGLLRSLGSAPEAVAGFRRAVELQPERVEVHSNLLYTLNFDPAYDPPTVFAEHLAWAARHAEPLTVLAPPHANDRTPGRRLRIGYLSAHFRHHAVNFFTEPVLASHNHPDFEIFCYSANLFDDAVTARLKAHADHWRDIRDQSDEQVANAVRQDRIDILVDLTGHIDGHRLLVFARKPAPIQVTYLGYQNTTGMSAMDYRLTDEQADPPGMSEMFYTEKLIRLPRSFFCYRPPGAAPPVTPLPTSAAGRVTFGSFNNFAKVGSEALAAWWNILKRVPESRLLVLAYGAAEVARQLHASIRAAGIEPDRLEVFDQRPLGEYLQLIQQADIGLDPFPFTGHTTTCDSIWMGVPVVMLRGNTYASRFGGSVLANVGLDHLMTNSVEQYVDVAVELAGNLDALARMRGELRGRMADSALVDFRGFTGNLEQVYRQMWVAWCASKRAPAE
jgi:protein O-GlcNAc transferase